jgi:ribonuclease HI
MIEFYTDGSCQPNPGPGGYAVIHLGEPIALGYKSQANNNRMEGLAILAALRLARQRDCVILTDSKLWVDILTVWANRWLARGWRETILDLDIVVPAYRLYNGSRAEIQWVRGHNGLPGNRLADYWANKARVLGREGVIDEEFIH